MIGKSQEQLRQLKSLIHENTKNPVLIHTLAADVQDGFEEDFFEKIFAEIEGLDISIIINASHFVDYSFFSEIPLSKIKESISGACLSSAMLINYALRNMLTRKNRNAIINVSSSAGSMPYPYLSLQSSIGAFTKALSASLK